MKIGIITSGKQRYSLVLFYFLVHKSIKPDCIIVMHDPFYKRILRNFNYTGIKTLLNSIEQFLNKHTQETKRDSLREFIKKNGILVPEISLLKACKKEKVKYVRLNDINAKKAIDYFQEIQLDILINASSGEIFRSAIINSINLGILNAHMGYLPDFRGMNVLEWSVLYNRDIGVTLHFIDQGIDTGDILSFKHIPFEAGDTIEDLRNKSGVINLELIIEGVKGLKTGNLPRKKQKMNDGKQYFVMHPRLKMIVEEKLKKSLDIIQQ